MKQLQFMFLGFFLSSSAFSQLNLTTQQAREDLGIYIGKAGLYQGVEGNNLKLKSCYTLQTMAGNGDNKNFFIEVKDEVYNGKQVVNAQAYIKDKAGNKVYCSEILESPQVIKSNSVRSRQEICRHLGCALTHFSSPKIFNPEVVATIKSTCPTYNGVLSADENISAFRQELENVADLCREIDYTADEVDVTDEDYAKLPNTHGAAPSLKSGVNLQH